jgi:hypothetical protein
MLSLTMSALFRCTSVRGPSLWPLVALAALSDNAMATTTQGRSSISSTRPDLMEAGEATGALELGGRRKLQRFLARAAPGGSRCCRSYCSPTNCQCCEYLVQRWHRPCTRAVSTGIDQSSRQGWMLRFRLVWLLQLSDPSLPCAAREWRCQCCTVCWCHSSSSRASEHTCTSETRQM